MRRLERIQRIAAFSSSHVVGYEGETTEHTPNIASVNLDGSLQAAASASVKKASKSNGRIRDSITDETYMLSHGTTRGVHELNKAEIVVSLAIGWSNLGASRTK